MIDFTKGGRGKTAPYQTTHCRIPEPIKHLVDQISTAYKKLLEKNSTDSQGKQLIEEIQAVIDQVTYQENNLVNKFQKFDNVKTFDEALEIAKKIVKSKKSAKISLAKLLSEIYEQKVKEDKLGGNS